MRLVYTAEPTREVKLGDEVVLRDGEVVVVQVIERPHKPSSTGRVHVKGRRKDDFTHSFYPSVIGAEWAEREDAA